MKRCILFLGLAATTIGAVARADDKSDCLAAASSGQTLRDEHKLVEARAQFRLCARAQCPAVVQASCAEWIDAAEKSIPTVVLGAKNGVGADLVDVTVAMDGNVIVTRLAGTAIPIDPGLHAFHFALADGTTADANVVVEEGDQAQHVDVVLGKAKVADTSADRAPTPPEGTSPRAIAGVSIAGAGVIALGAGAYFGVTALSKNGDSAPYCNVGGVKDACYGPGVGLRSDAVRDASASTVLVGVGVTALAGGLVLWLTTPSSRSKAALSFDGRTWKLGGTF